MEALKGARLFDPKVDVAFKMIFTETKEGKAAFIDFLNDILESGTPIKDLIHLPTHFCRSLFEKESIMDIRIKTQNNLEIDVEMQVRNVKDYISRSMYYLAKMYANQEIKGMEYFKLKKCIVINILDFTLIKESDKMHNVYRFKEIYQNNELTDLLEVHFIELPKFHITNADQLSPVEKWVCFFKYAGDTSKEEIIKSIICEKEGIRLAYESLIKVSADESFRAAYDSRERFIIDWNSRVKTARAEGIAEGEVKAKLEIARNLINNGLDIKEVALLTNIQETEIKKLCVNE